MPRRSTPNESSVYAFICRCSCNAASIPVRLKRCQHIIECRVLKHVVRLRFGHRICVCRNKCAPRIFVAGQWRGASGLSTYRGSFILVLLKNSQHALVARRLQYYGAQSCNFHAFRAVLIRQAQNAKAGSICLFRHWPAGKYCYDKALGIWAVLARLCARKSITCCHPAFSRCCGSMSLL